MAGGRWWPFQQFMIKAAGNSPIEDVDFRGAANACATPEVLQAIATAEAIVIGPSNPVISIDPILAVRGVRGALKESPAAVVAVSPLVAGAVVKGPTASFMAWAGHPLTSDGIAAYYEAVIDGLVADTRVDAMPVLETDVLMGTPEGRRRVADETLRFALALR
jgi:LPPG:FO 2-phospho-L-lactate transferase